MTYELFLSYEKLKISLKLVHKKRDLKMFLLNIIILNFSKNFCMKQDQDAQGYGLPFPLRSSQFLTKISREGGKVKIYLLLLTVLLSFILSSIIQQIIVQQMFSFVSQFLPILQFSSCLFSILSLCSTSLFPSP